MSVDFDKFLLGVVFFLLIIGSCLLLPMLIG